MPAGEDPWGARQRKRRVVSTRSAACAREIQPCSAPTGYALSPKPTAATLEKDGEGQRSGTSPLAGFARSQKKRNVRSCSVSTNACSETGGGVRGAEGEAQAASSRPRAKTKRRIWFKLA